MCEASEAGWENVGDNGENAGLEEPSIGQQKLAYKEWSNEIQLNVQDQTGEISKKSPFPKNSLSFLFAIDCSFAIRSRHAGP